MQWEKKNTQTLSFHQKSKTAKCGVFLESGCSRDYENFTLEGGGCQGKKDAGNAGLP